ncbi:two-component sensor histidine kinase [Paenibacillus cisolokensis]|uniref:histidine kinase n=1 Tax=Paenibacillus cisolokensis TaxID=1658519 RepID=A0ABQ4N4C9_9BACL|nr:HAMP domain-containing sensor histidine kinase [Paenibacillus cisolokensis]GIQ63020.1 two-component sensor histidine kinase [Paenibacillus cisolokensis]
MKNIADWSLKSQFVLGFALILLLSLLATAATYALGAVLFTRMEYKGVYPANYYEKQIPDIKEYIRKENTALLNPSAKEELERQVPGAGFLYQVVDGDGNYRYGTLHEPVFEGRQQLYDGLNKPIRYRGRYVQTVPIIGGDGRIAGAVLLSYSLSPTFAEGQGWLAAVFAAFLLSPFFYIFLFTLLFAKTIAGRINEPIRMLMRASRKVADKDLDFTIEYRSGNELGQLCSAFARMQEELRSSLSAQWRLEREKAEMIEALAHDLKTPISIISGYAEALLDSRAPEDKLRRYLTVIRDNASKSAGLVRQLQYSAELERFEDRLNVSPVELVSWTGKLIKQFKPAAAAKGIRLSFLPEGAMGVCRIDPEKLERILGNIVSNSISYTPEGGRIEVGLAVEGRQVRFRIRDTGPGFPPGEEERAFERFYRADKARGQSEGHSGLGLYIARRLVESHGGEIKACNAEDGGAVVSFVIAAAGEEGVN